ncbi:MAG: hypothetical protein KDD40_01020 [Bdellovibrionales bacterium]|nr:hypothetical protein [Bdellovibrionales bacterium]
MKFVYMIVLSLFIILPVHAESLVPNILYSQFEDAVLEHDQFLRDKLLKGTLEVDLSAKTVSLVLAFELACPEDANCPTLGSWPYSETFPIEYEFVERCNAKVYVGKLVDSTNPDKYTRIVVLDNTTNTCESLLPVPATDVYYVSYEHPNPEPLKVSRFWGSALKFINQK